MTSWHNYFIWIIFSILYFSSCFIESVSGRVAGKVGYSNTRLSGRSYSGINDELIAICIGMATTIFILISIALCYIAHEKWTQKRGYYVNV